MGDHIYHQWSKDDYTHANSTLRDNEIIEAQPRRSYSYGHLIFLILTAVLLAAAVYCKLSEVSFLENCWDVVRGLTFLQNKVPSLLQASIVWQALKALCIGVLVLFFTWGVMYFDSTTPGVEPPSPLSPQKVREVSGHTFHTGYILAVINGLLCAVFFLLWS